MSSASIGLSANNQPNHSKSITALLLSVVHTQEEHGKKMMDKEFMRLLLDLSNAARMGELSPSEYEVAYDLTADGTLPKIPYLELTDGWDFAGYPYLPNWERASMFILDPDLYRKWVTDWRHADDSNGASAALQVSSAEGEADMEEDSECA